MLQINVWSEPDVESHLQHQVLYYDSKFMVKDNFNGFVLENSNSQYALTQEGAPFIIGSRCSNNKPKVFVYHHVVLHENPFCMF